jgi:hypothetical protein
LGIIIFTPLFIIFLIRSRLAAEGLRPMSQGRAANIGKQDARGILSPNNHSLHKIVIIEAKRFADPSV